MSSKPEKQFKVTLTPERTLPEHYIKDEMARRTLFMSSMFSALLVTGLALSSCDLASRSKLSASQITLQESHRINQWFEARYQDGLARSPMTQTYLGLKSDNHRLDNSSVLAMDEDAALMQSWLKELRSDFDYDRLDTQSKLSYRLYEFDGKDQLAVQKFADHDYIFQHMSGPHAEFPSFMINSHTVNSMSDAQGYIARLSAFSQYLGGFIDRAEAQYNDNVRLPAFVYPKISESARNVITGAPFTDEPDSPLYSDIKSKISGLNITDPQKSDLTEQARTALLTKVQPAYLRLIDMTSRHAEEASEDDGVWKLPRGEAYYQSRLKHFTTTKMTAEEIHAIGLKDVERIQGEMREIMKTVNFEGDLLAFFKFLRTDERFTYANDEAGREAYIDKASTYISEMNAMMDPLFNKKPRAQLIVKRVEPYREASAFGAFYEQPALDGSRPGTYYINLKDMAELPIYQMQALAYHEGTPGHHMQIAMGMELEGLPKFRTLGGHTAYIEGWALYAEGIPTELQLYTDPYKDFGRLSMEIFRSARLVVDTGLHAKKWTREEAVKYMMENTANSEGDIRAEVDRYIVWPGQATAYKVGMLKIVELKAKAQAELGDRFDIRGFHDVILANGSVPLSILDELVENWIVEEKSKAEP